jgi:intein-encoded DNA endonuclease-like protein/endogenous inhibitor of DNA gyrase (YacG/DUF329 family)
MPAKGTINPHLWKYRINIDFFKKPTPQMAYVLGFLMADGRLERNSVYFIVGKKEDRQILEKMNNAMGSNYPIKQRKDGSFRVRIHNPIIIQDLRKLGINFDKMKNVSLPKIPSSLFRDFVRGFLDGDGWITPKKRKMEISVGFSNGNYKFLKVLIAKLNAILNLTTHNLRKREKIAKKNKNSAWYQIEYYSENAYKILNYLYENLKEDDLFLPRKYQRYLKAVKIYKELKRDSELWRKVEGKFNMPMVQLLKKLYFEKKLTGVEIANKLKVHPSSIYRWLAKTGIKFPSSKQKTIVITKCLICGKEIGRFKRQEVKYCSLECRVKARRTGKLVKCLWCGKEIYRPNWWFKINNKPFCSRKCIGEWQRMRVKENLLPRSQITGRFLSLATNK